MRQPGGCQVLCLLLVAVIVPAGASPALWTIRRNKQDCIYPPIATNAETLWRFRSQLPKYLSFTSGNGFVTVDVSSAGFTIEYWPTYKIITNKLVNEKYLLYHCGSAAPQLGITKTFSLPLSSMSVADASAADYMTQLTLMDRVAYAGELAVSGCLQALAACGYIAADDPSSASIREQVDSFFIFGFGTSTDPMSISFNAVSATTPLDRTKWLFYIAAFSNKEVAANALYQQIRADYTSLRADALSQRGQKPLVCWVYKDWDGDYAMSFAPYKMTYVTDAGGQMYPWSNLTDSGMVPKPKGSTSTLVYNSTMDNVAAYWAGVLSLCDVIIDESFEMSTGGLTDMDGTNPDGFLQTHGIVAYQAQIPAVTAKRVYTIAKTTGVTVTNPNSMYKGYVGLQWFERGVSRCDEVLRDLIMTINPGLQNPLLNGWTMQYLLRLDGVQQQQRVPAVCTLATAKLNGCKRSGYAARVCPTAVRDCDTGVMQWPPAEQRCRLVSQQVAARLRRQLAGQRPDCVRKPA